MEEKQNAALGTAPLGKLMVKFALPCTISLLVGALYNIVDQIFIGWGVGYLGNGATNVVFPLTVLALGLAVMIGDGACSYVSICFGKNRQEDADCAVGSAVTLSVLVGVLVAGFYAVFQTPILLLFGAESALYNEFAVLTFRVYLCMLPLATVNKAAFIFMQALGRPVESAGLSFFREVLLAVPLVLLLPRAFGLMGVLYSMPAADIVTFLASAVVLVRTDRQLRK